MVWSTYTYKAGPKGGTLVALSTYCSSVRIVDEGMAGKRGSNVPVQYYHGYREVAHKFTNQHLIGLEVVLRYSDSTGTITHTDLAPGHVYENLAEVKRLLSGEAGLATLERIAPDQGTVQIDVECLQPVMSSQNRFTFLFPLTAHDPFWRSTSLNTDTTITSITVGGSAPVQDAEILLPAADVSPVLTHTSSTATVDPTITYEGTVPTGGVRIYCKTGFAEKEADQTDQSEFIAYNKPYILELYPGTNTFTYSGSGAPTIYWYDKWR